MADQYWVRQEHDDPAEEFWRGPFSDLEEAAVLARHCSTPGMPGSTIFAEVLCGVPGGHGRRVREFFDGFEYATEESQWYDSPPPPEVLIPRRLFPSE